MPEVVSPTSASGQRRAGAPSGRLPRHVPAPDPTSQLPQRWPRRRIISLLLVAATVVLTALILVAELLWPSLLQPLHPDGRPRSIYPVHIGLPGGGPGP